MKIHGQAWRSLWWDAQAQGLRVINQLKLPHVLETLLIQNADQAAQAIRSMAVRGAPLIGLTGAYGLALALRYDAGDTALEQAADLLLQTRPTAVNLRYAVEAVRSTVRTLAPAQRAMAALELAAQLAEEDVALCHAIGQHGLALLEQTWARRAQGRTLNILTHCNAGWLATVDWGTALAPIYAAHDRGLPVHVWVDETRPRLQGSLLTALELGWHGVPHTIVADNAGGHLMQRGAVDLCIVGADRVTSRGDTANKIGTYLKALAARDNDVDFHVALPSPSMDWNMHDGLAEIPIEERAAHEVVQVQGLDADQVLRTVRVAAPESPAANPAFDVTPARLITSFITERGVFAPHALHRLKGRRNLHI